MNRNDVLKIQRMVKRLQKIWRDWRNSSKKIYFYHRVSEYREMWRNVAIDNDARFTVLSDDVWEYEYNGRKTKIVNHEMEFDNPVTLILAGRKPLMHRMLREGGLPVPDHLVFRLAELEKAYAFLEAHPPYCVIKPGNGTHAGDGVTTHVMTRREIRKAAILASLYCQDLLIESQVPGECYRVLVIGGEVAHAVRRRGPRLTGDGRSSVRQLILAENERRKHQGTRILTVDRDCLFTLSWQKLTLESIPPSEHDFIVKTVDDPRGKLTEIRTVYNENVTGLICASVKRHAEMAANILGSDFVGVDIITPDPTVPLEESGGSINEVNTTPALHHHYNPENEKYPKIALQIINFLLSKAKATETGPSSR